jgi:hypothetical protein
MSASTKCGHYSRANHVDTVECGAVKQGKNGNGSPLSKLAFVAATQHANKIDPNSSGCC